MHETKHPVLASKRERGFSMAEVLVAVALLSVILLALFGLVTAGVQRAYGGRKMTEATILAQAVLERANIEGPQTLMSSGVSPAVQSWTMTSGVVTPIAETGSTIAIVERNAWRAALANSRLPSASNSPATLTVTMTALPDAAPETVRTFANAATVRIVVEVTWSEGTGEAGVAGKRTRTVRLQTLNVRSANL